METRSGSLQNITPPIMSHGEPKPSISLNNTPPASLDMTRTSLQFGEGPELPLYLAKLLQEWHSRNGNKFPPCHTQSVQPTKPFKVFDRNGNEGRMEITSLTAPNKYRVMVIYPLNAPARLVGKAFPFGTKNVTFLRGWLGVDGGFETGCCSILCFGDTAYSPDHWEWFERLMARQRENEKTSPENSPPQKSPSPKSPLVLRRLPGRPPKRKRVWSGLVKKAKSDPALQSKGSKSDTKEEDDSSAEADSSEEDSSSGSEEDDETTPPRSAKKIKVEPASPTKAGTVFKLVSFKSGAVRRFPVEECQTGKELFKKARLFYKLFDRNVEVNVLSCQISSEREQHYLFDGSEGEFRLLIDHVNGINLNIGGPLTIEIGYVVEQ